MATAADVAALEADVPWLRPDFRAGLDALRESTAVAARRFADDMQTLAWLAEQVPRCRGDERGATPWTSFLRQVAVAHTLSDRGAVAEVRAAQALSRLLPCTFALLQEGRITVQRARKLITEVESLDDDIATRIDAGLAHRAAGLPLWRIAAEVRRAAARLDPDAAAQRAAQKNASRGVSLLPDDDDQASVTIVGPAVPLTRWYESLDSRARALKQAGDPRGLDALRFDLATSTFPCATHAPQDPTGLSAPAGPVGASRPDAGVGLNGDGRTCDAGAGLRSSFVEAAPTDCRMGRPVQASISVPVETALGLSSEPGWLDGYGWLSAPTCRLLLVDAELRQVCVQSGTGQLVSTGERDVRPPPTPAGVRAALLDMVISEADVGETAWRTEDQHDPSPPLRALVQARDRFCDGPTGTRRSALRCDLDHDIAHPEGPTAAWNLVARAQRTHQLKHYGWGSLRTPTSTLWFSPAGQVVEVPHHTTRPPGIDDGSASGTSPVLPDAEELAAVDLLQLTPLADDDPRPPYLPASERGPAPQWLLIPGSEPLR